MKSKGATTQKIIQIMQVQQYDIIIIGGGSAGLGALGMAQKLGWKALIIDKEEAHIGGDCLNFGCVPSKALIHIAKQFYGAKKAQALGLEYTMLVFYLGLLSPNLKLLLLEGQKSI